MFKIDDLTTSLLTELNLDASDESKTLISNLIKDANDLTLSAIDTTSNFDDFSSNQTYLRAVKTLATQLFYDRTLENGTAQGYRMMVAKLQAQKAILNMTTTTTTAGGNS